MTRWWWNKSINVLHPRALDFLRIPKPPLEKHSPFSTVGPSEEERGRCRYLGPLPTHNHWLPPPSFHRRGDIQHKTAREILSSLSKWVPIKQAEFTADEIVFIIGRTHALCTLLSKLSKIRLHVYLLSEKCGSRSLSNPCEGEGKIRDKDRSYVITNKTLNVFASHLSMCICPFVSWRLFVTSSNSKGNNVRRI